MANDKSYDATNAIHVDVEGKVEGELKLGPVYMEEDPRRRNNFSFNLHTEISVVAEKYRSTENSASPRARIFLPPCKHSRNKLTFFYRKIQDALEKHNRENFKKREVEKRKVDEATEKAKELMRVKKNEVFPLLFNKSTAVFYGLSSYRP